MTKCTDSRELNHKRDAVLRLLGQTVPYARRETVLQTSFHRKLFFNQFLNPAENFILAQRS